MDSAYLSLRYNSKARWLSYWYQISETLEVSPANVLVIGKGSGVTESTIDSLTNKKVQIVTLDINYAVNATVVGEAAGLPFKNDSFDALICCQVLEHIPYEKLALTLSEMHRVTRKRIVLSLPQGRKHCKIEIDVPLLGERRIILKNPFTKGNCSSKQHHWEIGRGVSRKEVIRQLKRIFDIEKEYLSEIGCDQRFFILKRKKLV